MIFKTILSRPINFSEQCRSYARRMLSDKVNRGSVKYYPRHPNHKDPPITPTKLLMVQRVKPYKGNPYWHKNTLDDLKLNDKKSKIAVVKNTPENCSMLWQIKHLIKITPINLPENIPQDDSKATVLHENGDLLVAPRLDPARLQATLDHINNHKRLDRETIETELRLRWLNPWDL